MLWAFTSSSIFSGSAGVSMTTPWLVSGQTTMYPLLP